MITKKFDRNQFWRKLKASLARGSPVIAAGVGSGLTAKAACCGAADIIAVYNTAVYRVRGLATSLAFLPYDDANALTLSVLPEIMANVSDVPVLAGFGAHDPRVPIDKLLDQAQAFGVDGVTNEPFVGIYGEDLRTQLEAAGLGFSREVELIKCASDRGLLTLGWAFNPKEVDRMVEAGTQFVGAMIGVTAGGNAGGQSITPLDEAAEAIKAMVQAAKKTGKDVMVLGHGGPLSDPKSVQRVLELSGADGYVTGSTGERMPVEAGIAETIKQYKSLKVKVV
jgi:predicted TIM-barrel enzyme